MDKPVTLAAIAGAHGVAGEVRLKLFGEGIDALSGYARFNDDTLTIRSIRADGKGGAIARFAEVTDRTAAERLRGTTLSVPRSTMPPLEEGEYYHADLIGLSAVTISGAALGEVVAIDNFGAGDLAEVRGSDGKLFYIPLSEAAVPGWTDTTLTVADEFAP